MLGFLYLEDTSLSRRDELDLLSQIGVKHLVLYD